MLFSRVNCLRVFILLGVFPCVPSIFLSSPLYDLLSVFVDVFFYYTSLVSGTRGTPLNSLIFLELNDQEFARD